MFVYTQVNAIPYLFIFLSLFCQKRNMIFEITKEGTESILIKWNTFLKATLGTASAKSRKLE